MRIIVVVLPRPTVETSFVDIRAVRVVLSMIEGWPFKSGWTDEATGLEIDLAELSRQLRRFMRAGGRLGRLAKQAVQPAVNKGLSPCEASTWAEFLRRELLAIAYPQ